MVGLNAVFLDGLGCLLFCPYRSEGLLFPLRSTKHSKHTLYPFSLAVCLEQMGLKHLRHSVNVLVWQ